MDDHYEYDITYTGEGVWDITPRYINHIGKAIDYVALIQDGEVTVLTMDEIGIGTDSRGGEVTMEYSTTIR